MSGIAPRAGRRATPAASTTPTTFTLAAAPVSSPTWTADNNGSPGVDFLSNSPLASPSSFPPLSTAQPPPPSTPVQDPLSPAEGGDLPWLSETAPPSALQPQPISTKQAASASKGPNLPFLDMDEEPPVRSSHSPSQEAVGSESERGVSPVHSVEPRSKPRTLEEIRDALIDELQTVEGSIGRQEILLSGIRGDTRRAVEGHKLQLELRRADCEREIATITKKRRDDSRFLEGRLHSINAKKMTEATELNYQYRSAQEQRKRSLLSEVGADIAAVHRDIEKFNAQKELLTSSNPWDTADPDKKPDSAVSARLGSASTLEEKLVVATDLLLDHHKALDEKMERRVAHFVNLETALAADSNYETRRRILHDGMQTRKEKFSGFKTGLLEQSTRFYATRHDTRNSGIHEIQEHQRAVLGELRASSLELTSATQADAHSQFEIAVVTHKAALETETLRVKSKYATLEEQDAKLSLSQRTDMESRFTASRALSERLQREERESLQLGLSKEAERSHAMLAEGQTRVLSCMRSPDGSALHDSKEVHNAVTQLNGAVEKSLNSQLERNSAYRLLLSHSDGSAAVPRGVDSKEAKLLGLLQEKQGVLRAMQTASKQQLEHLSSSRESMLSTLGKVEAKMTGIAAQIHDGRLQQQASLARVDVTRSSWEDEHRAMLSFGKRSGGGEPLVDFRDGGAGFHPALQVLHHVANQVRSSALRASELHTNFVAKRKSLLSQQHAQDVQLEGEGAALADAWQSLMERMLNYNDEFKRVSTQQVTILGEEAKVAVESDLLFNERAALSKRGAALAREQEELRQRGRRLQEESAQITSASGALDQENVVAAGEVLRLVKLQTDLRQQQASHFADLRRLDNAKVRMLGSWGRRDVSLPNQTALLSTSAPSGAASDADTSFVPMHYYPPSTSSSSKAPSTPQHHRTTEALTEPPSPVSS